MKSPDSITTRRERFAKRRLPSRGITKRDRERERERERERKKREQKKRERERERSRNIRTLSHLVLKKSQIAAFQFADSVCFPAIPLSVNV